MGELEQEGRIPVACAAHLLQVQQELPRQFREKRRLAAVFAVELTHHHGPAAFVVQAAQNRKIAREQGTQIIEEKAPEDRHPILTFVGPYEARTVSAAIRREMLREGQVFYVHNRVQSIDHAVARLRALVPEARYVVAHGQMSEGQLEQVMLDFWERSYDVMVSTTIIESGLDLPQVNTLIVERDLPGPAQLYQLRPGGTPSQRAYAYLFHTEERKA
jgi:RecG-like helicase